MDKIGTKLPAISETASTEPSTTTTETNPTLEKRRKALALERLFTFCRAFGVKVGDQNLAMGFYVKSFRSTPAFKLEAAIDKLTSSGWKKTTLPKPADILELVAAGVQYDTEGREPREKVEITKPRLRNIPGKSQFAGYENATEERKDELILAEIERLKSSGRSSDARLASLGRRTMAREAAENEGKYL